MWSVARNVLDEPFLMAGPKPLLIEFDILGVAVSEHSDFNQLYIKTQPLRSAKLSLRHPLTIAVQWHLLILAFLGLFGFFSFLLYVVQNCATKCRSVLKVIF